MKLREKLENDMKEAMKLKESGKSKLDAIRLVRSTIQNKEIDSKCDLTDEEVLSVIQKEISDAKETLEQYKDKMTQDSIEKLEKRVSVLTDYLPKQLTESEIEEVIKNVMVEQNIQGKQDMGKLMKNLMPLVKGKADGKVVNGIVNKLLQ